MSQTAKYKVMREHEGDRFYKAGETREISDADARQLVSLGVLAPMAAESAAKAESSPPNKAEKPLSNKAK